MIPSGRAFLLFAALVVFALLLSVSVGSSGVPFSTVISALLAPLTGALPDDSASRIVLSLRLPRALLGLLVGASLSASGVAFQSLLRNPLADPYLLGVSGGAAVGALLAMLLLPASLGVPVSAAAFIGAASASSLVFLLARRRGGVSRERLILSGVVVGAFLNALIMLVVSLAPPGRISGAVFWLMGDLGLGTGDRVASLLPYAAAGLCALFSMARGMDLLLLGDEGAFQSGLPVDRFKTALYLAASLLSGAVVAVSGLIGFVGLIVPHAARLLVGSSHRRLLPASVLLGGAFLVLSDTLARTVSPAGELPVGAVTALLGAPIFLFLLTRDGGRS